MNILTIDVEDWFHLINPYPSIREFEASWEKHPSRVLLEVEKLLVLFEKHSVKATFFILGWVATHHPDVVRRIAGLGHDLGVHSYWHRPVNSQTPSEFREDLARALDAVESATGVRCNKYRAPGLSMPLNAAEYFHEMRALGVTIDSSYSNYNGSHSTANLRASEPYIIDTPAGAVLELPVVKAPAFGLPLPAPVGGAFRLLPISLISRQIRNNKYYMSYFHPRDFDSNQPVLDGLPLLRRFKSYIGLSRSELKLDVLLRNFDFIDVESAVDIIHRNANCSKMPTE